MGRERKADGSFAEIHGMRRTKIYGIWCAMKSRCTNPHSTDYPRYGGRGITVCDEWMSSFISFYEWAKTNGYKDGLTIDRVENNLGYFPENCRWATRAQQNRNYSRNHTITYSGKTQCLSDWADETGINRATILYRLKAGKPLEEVFANEDGRIERWKKAITAN